MRTKQNPSVLRRILAYPQDVGADVDDPRVTYQRRTIIREKRLLHAIYEEWYSMQIACLPTSSGITLEIGSGAGFFKERNDRTLTSEVFYCPFVDAILDGTRIPLSAAALRSIVMTDVFHHIPDVEQFFREALRTLRKGGRIIMIEPWVSRWSRWVMDHFHSEPMDVSMQTWQFPSHGPLSSSNQALPWIVFERDRILFEQKFPDLKVITLQPFMPFRYLLSGGVSMRALIPAGCNAILKGIERKLDQRKWAMFALIVLEKKADRKP